MISVQQTNILYLERLWVSPRQRTPTDVEIVQTKESHGIIDVEPQHERVDVVLALLDATAVHGVRRRLRLPRTTKTTFSSTQFVLGLKRISSFSWSTTGRISFSQLFLRGVCSLRNANSAQRITPKGYVSIWRTANATYLLFALQIAPQHTLLQPCPVQRVQGIWVHPQRFPFPSCLQRSRRFPWHSLCLFSQRP